jgi:predicted type IV restriction endonuclease
MSFDIAALYDASQAAVGSAINRDGATRTLNETETRTQIIDPILVALGYKTLDLVRREYRLQASGQAVDYYLLAGEQRVVIEAKQVGAELGPKDASQLVGYCAQEGVRWALLTNGIQWQVFDIELSGGYDSKRFAEIDLADAYRLGKLAEALTPLAHFALDTLSVDDSALIAWAHEERFRRHLDRLLQDPASPVIQSAVGELAKVSIDVEPEDVIALLRKGSARPTEQVESVRENVQQQQIGGTTCYIFPAGDEGGFPATEHLKRWITAGYWGVGKSTAHRSRLKTGDACCFYAKRVGIVAKALIAGPASELVSIGEWPGPGPFAEDALKVPLANIHWLEKPVEVSVGLRGNLEAFRGKDMSRPWSWLIQTTRRISEHDFKLLTVGSAGLSAGKS